MPKFIDVDPGELHLPPGRSQGADPAKLARQIAKHGDSLEGMPPLQVTRGRDGKLRINDGVTRATRAAKLQPGMPVEAEVIQELPKLNVTRTPKVKEKFAMNEATHSQLFDALAELRQFYPEWRFGQLISNVAGWADQEVWDIDDEQLLAAAKKHIDDVSGTAARSRA